MSENRGPCCSSSPKQDLAYIDTYRILDSCRDKDCFEDVPVYLSEYGRDVIEHSTNIRTCSASILSSHISVVPVPFNNGFYQIDIRIYVKMTFEACVCMSNRQIIEGVAVVDKRVVLFGSQGNVSIFKSDPDEDGFCSCRSLPDSDPCHSTNLPMAVFEVASPVVLNTRILEKHAPKKICCLVGDIPEVICRRINGGLCEHGEKILAVSLGFFSVTRIERPEQYLLNAAEYSVPEKECECFTDDDPCTVFRRMDFPVNEFSPPAKDTKRCK